MIQLGGLNMAVKEDNVVDVRPQGFTRRHGQTAMGRAPATMAGDSEEGHPACGIIVCCIEVATWRVKGHRECLFNQTFCKDRRGAWLEDRRLITKREEI